MFKDELPVCSSEISVFVHLKLSFYHFFKCGFSDPICWWVTVLNLCCLPFWLLFLLCTSVRCVVSHSCFTMAAARTGLLSRFVFLPTASPGGQKCEGQVR